MKRLMILAIPLLFVGLPLRAQEDGGKAREVVDEENAGQTYGEATPEDEKERILRAIELPQAAEQAREEGVPPEQVKDVLEAARRRKLPAGETEAIMTEETKAVRDKGQIDDFGSFVKSKLDEGLRGRELSEAIRAEHAARGKGRGHDKGDKQRSGRKQALDDDADRDAGTDAGDKRAGEGSKKGKEAKPEKAKGEQDKKKERS